MPSFPPVRYLRIYADAVGESHLEDVDAPVQSAGAGPDSLARSSPFAATSLTFVAASPDWDFSWHNAPQLQFVLLLEGSVEVETSDGDVRRLVPGAVILAEDTTGRGHITRSVASARVLLGIVPVTKS
jgi:hypothetical protein